MSAPDTTAFGGIPALPGARCLGQWQVFDATLHVGRGAPSKGLIEARQAAVRICLTCPALAACRAWLADLPPKQRPVGVVAGLMVQCSDF